MDKLHSTVLCYWTCRPNRFAYRGNGCITIKILIFPEQTVEIDTWNIAA